MKNAIIGKKIGMTRIFDKEGKNTAVTVLEVKPCIVTQIKSNDIDGYEAIQIASNDENNLTKPQAGHLKKSNATSKYLKEFKLERELKVGDKIELSEFKPGLKVKVSSISKGKGFAGVIKRHNFQRGPETHGSDHHRAPGSIGGGYPQRVVKGKRMAGHMGAERVSVKNLQIIDIDNEKNILVLKGCVPGFNGSIVEIVEE